MVHIRENTREDAWTEKEDEILLKNALETINGTGTLTNTFRTTADEIGRTVSAVRFRYYNVIKHDNKSALKDAWIEKIKKINAGG